MAMRFFEVLVQVVGLLVLEQRLSYQALKRLFDLDDAYLNGIKVELMTSASVRVREFATSVFTILRPNCRALGLLLSG
jgi:hypothetical protein